MTSALIIGIVLVMAYIVAWLASAVALLNAIAHVESPWADPIWWVAFMLILSGLVPKVGGDS